MEGGGIWIERTLLELFAMVGTVGGTNGVIIADTTLTLHERTHHAYAVHEALDTR
tara:strand:+ start:1053 stop:1217 length:165 start_codon:yes stop_codon:yes gene_type:complete